MIKRLIDWFRKENDVSLDVPKGEKAKFSLKLKDLPIGELRFEENVWHFKYTQAFIDKADEFYTIPGFPNLEKEYISSFLWPFFKVRIPGIKQPAIKEILEKEDISEDEVSLLKRFGLRSIASPYILES